MTDYTAKINALLAALEQMANDAGRKQLNMHPSRHTQAVERVEELVQAGVADHVAEVERLRAENTALRELAERATRVNGMSEWNLAGLADTARALLGKE